jgi:hypothetical protein
MPENEPLSKPGPVGTKGPVAPLGPVAPGMSAVDPPPAAPKSKIEQENEVLRKKLEEANALLANRDVGRDATGLMQFNNVTNFQARQIRAAKRGKVATTPEQYRSADRDWEDKQSRAAQEVSKLAKTLIGAANLK